MKYRELYPKSLSSGTGLIAQLSQKEGIPWKTDKQDISSILERAFGIRYGFKTILDSFAELPESVRADVLAVMYSQKWSRLWDDYLLQYEVLDAYHVTENGNRSVNKDGSDVIKYGKTVNESSSDTGTIDRTENNTTTYGHTVAETGSEEGSINRTDEETLKHGHTVTETGSDTGNVETSSSNDNTSTDSVYGFNSPLAMPSNTESGTKLSESTETRDLETSKNITNAGQDEKSVTSTETSNSDTSKNVTNAGQDEVDSVTAETRDSVGSRNVTNAGQDEKNHNTTEDEDYSYTKKGNIGYTTPQELIRQDMALWATPFFDIVFSDIDEFIMLQTFTV